MRALGGSVWLKAGAAASDKTKIRNKVSHRDTCFSRAHTGPTESFRFGFSVFCINVKFLDKAVNMV